MWGGLEGFYDQQERDMAVKIYCRKYGIKLVTISYKDFDKIETILNCEFKNILHKEYGRYKSFKEKSKAV